MSHDNATIPAQDTNTNDAANGATSCVFYDTQTNGMCHNVLFLYTCVAFLLGLCTVTLFCFPADWSTEGCEMVMQDAGTVTCACNHLTAFSILQVHSHTHKCKHTHTQRERERKREERERERERETTGHHLYCLIHIIHSFTCAESS